MYYFVKMSNGWHGKRIETLRYSAGDIQEHIDNGDIVVLAACLEWFCDQMKVLEADITMAS